MTWNVCLMRVCDAVASTVCPLPSKESLPFSELKVTSLNKLSGTFLFLSVLRVFRANSELSNECEVCIRLPSEGRDTVSIIKSKDETIFTLLTWNQNPKTC